MQNLLVHHGQPPFLQGFQRIWYLQRLVPSDMEGTFMLLHGIRFRGTAVGANFIVCAFVCFHGIILLYGKHSKEILQRNKLYTILVREPSICIPFSFRCRYALHMCVPVSVKYLLPLLLFPLTVYTCFIRNYVFYSEFCFQARASTWLPTYTIYTRKR